MRLFHQGIKASTVLYSARFIPLVDTGLARVVEQITRDEERHIRWAEIRLGREATNKMRLLDPLLAEIEAAMETVWSRPWRRLSQASYGVGRVAS